MATDLEAVAKERDLKYFLISFTDLMGVQRAKLVPASAIGGMARAGAAFAGFATWPYPSGCCAAMLEFVIGGAGSGSEPPGAVPGRTSVPGTGVGMRGVVTAPDAAGMDCAVVADRLFSRVRGSAPSNAAFGSNDSGWMPVEGSWNTAFGSNDAGAIIVGDSITGLNFDGCSTVLGSTNGRRSADRARSAAFGSAIVRFGSNPPPLFASAASNACLGSNDNGWMPVGSA